MLEKDLEIGKCYIFGGERIKYLGTNRSLVLYDSNFAINYDFFIFVFRMDNGKIIQFNSLQAIREFNKEKDKH